LKTRERERERELPIYLRRRGEKFEKLKDSCLLHTTSTNGYLHFTLTLAQIIAIVIIIITITTTTALILKEEWEVHRS